jgi:pyruvate dehydrogenase (quinone)
MEGDPKFPPSQDLFDFPFARYAELLGLGGIRVEDPNQVANAWQRALSADRPVVIEAITDPNVPPLPPVLTDKQKQKLEQAFAAGDPDAAAARAHLERERKL